MPKRYNNIEKFLEAFNKKDTSTNTLLELLKNAREDLDDETIIQRINAVGTLTGDDFDDIAETLTNYVATHNTTPHMAPSLFGDGASQLHSTPPPNHDGNEADVDQTPPQERTQAPQGILANGPGEGVALFPQRAPLILGGAKMGLVPNIPVRELTLGALRSLREMFSYLYTLILFIGTITHLRAATQPDNAVIPDGATRATARTETDGTDDEKLDEQEEDGDTKPKKRQVAFAAPAHEEIDVTQDAEQEEVEEDEEQEEDGGMLRREHSTVGTLEEETEEDDESTDGQPPVTTPSSFSLGAARLITKLKKLVSKRTSDEAEEDAPPPITRGPAEHVEAKRQAAASDDEEETNNAVPADSRASSMGTVVDNGDESAEREAQQRLSALVTSSGEGEPQAEHLPGSMEQVD